MSLLLRIKDLAQAIGADIKALRVGKVDVVSGKGLSTNDYTTVEKSKLTGVAVGATKNATDAQLRDRGSHTGTQAATTITGLSDAATHPYGTTINTVMQGNDIRVVNGATAFGWGNHATAGYIKSYVDTTYTAGAGVTLTGGAFSVKYGSAANTSAQGNDSRINNGQAAFNRLNIGATAATARTALQLGSASTTEASDYAQSSHTHTWGQITGQPTTATRWPTFAEVTSKPSTYTPSSHTHPHTQVTGLGTAAVKDEGYFALRAGTATQDFTTKEVGTVAANIRATTGTEGVKLEYNTTTKSLDFNFY